MKEKFKKKSKVTILFFLLTLAFITFIARAIYILIGDNSNLPFLYSNEINRAVRGDIISKDGYTLATTKKLYMAEIDTRNLSLAQKNLFVNLFSIYSDLDSWQIKKTIDSHKGYVRFSYNIDEKKAKHLKTLARKLLRFGVFIEFIDVKNGKRFLHGLEIIQSEEYRDFIYKDTLTPVIGYMKKLEIDDMIKVKAVKGLEYFYRNKLESIRDFKLQGKKDVGSNIIFNKNTIIQNRLDGYDLHITISLRLQKAIEDIVDKFHKDLGTKEIIASVMDSQSGEILALVSSKRYNPNYITGDISALNVSAVEYVFEPGSVIKPITYALLLRAKKIKPQMIFKTHHGAMLIGKRVITDEHKFPAYLSAKNAIIYSSNIVLAKMVQKLTALEFYQGLKDFGFSSSSKIDLPYEHIGKIPNLQKFNSKIYKASSSYGYSINLNFIQLLRAYGVFNNGGILVTPHLLSHTVSPFGEIDKKTTKKIEILSEDVTKLVKDALIEVVNKGTAQQAKTLGIELGGKTGTAHIATKMGYQLSYNSSFFGFANDKNRKYTIGVTVIKPQTAYFASKTAVPIFKEIVDMMIYNNFLNIE